VKRTVISAAVLVLGLAGAGVSLADPGDGGPGPNGSNNHGLCTAYAHNGGGNSHNAPPFAQLEEDADAAGDGNGTASPQEIADYCAPFLGGNGNGNGNNGNPSPGGHDRG
jgi:hypothetical protein